MEIDWQSEIRFWRANSKSHHIRLWNFYSRRNW